MKGDHDEHRGACPRSDADGDDAERPSSVGNGQAGWNADANAKISESSTGQNSPTLGSSCDLRGLGDAGTCCMTSEEPHQHPGPSPRNNTSIDPSNEKRNGVADQIRQETRPRLGL